LPDDRPWFNGDYLAMVCTHLSKADFYITETSAHSPGFLMYWLVTAPQVPRQPLSESRHMASGIAQAMSAWANALQGSNGRELIRSYAEEKSCQVSEVGDHRLRIDAPSGGYLFVDFDESGDIYGIELPEEIERKPKKKSWLSRLFVGRG
jgi:hypothetical protein